MGKSHPQDFNLIFNLQILKGIADVIIADTVANDTPFPIAIDEIICRGFREFLCFFKIGEFDHNDAPFFFRALEGDLGDGDLGLHGRDVDAVQVDDGVGAGEVVRAHGAAEVVAAAKGDVQAEFFIEQDLADRGDPEFRQDPETEFGRKAGARAGEIAKDLMCPGKELWGGR